MRSDSDKLWETRKLLEFEYKEHGGDPSKWEHENDINAILLLTRSIRYQLY